MFAEPCSEAVFPVSWVGRSFAAAARVFSGGLGGACTPSGVSEVPALARGDIPCRPGLGEDSRTDFSLGASLLFLDCRPTPRSTLAGPRTPDGRVARLTSDVSGAVLAAGSSHLQLADLFGQREAAPLHMSWSDALARLIDMR
jgi:hypothetical protein